MQQIEASADEYFFGHPKPTSWKIVPDEMLHRPA
jgi:hypothetical protein